MIIVGCDHGGLELKEQVKQHLLDAGEQVEDIGIYEAHSVDYPDIASALCSKLLAGEYAFGILFCGTGIGISIAANKIHGIRCAHVTDEFSARMAKEHNNANVLAMGGRTLGPELACSIVDAYRGAVFAGGRHQNRVDKIHALER